MAESCTVESKTFSYSCADVCQDEYSPCVAFNASDASCADCVVDAGGVCKYHCFSFLDGTPYWAFLLEFGAYESAQEVAARAADSSFDEQVASLKNESVDYWHYSNDLLTRFSSIEIPSYVNTMYASRAPPCKTSFDYESSTHTSMLWLWWLAISIIAGGSSTNASDYIRGKVADFTFTGDLASSYSGVKEIGLMSLNLEDSADTLASLLAPNVEFLRLSNVLLPSMPSGLGEFAELQQL